MPNYQNGRIYRIRCDVTAINVMQSIQRHCPFANESHNRSRNASNSWTEPINITLCCITLWWRRLWSNFTGTVPCHSKGWTQCKNEVSGSSNREWRWLNWFYKITFSLHSFSSLAFARECFNLVQFPHESAEFEFFRDQIVSCVSFQMR